MPTDGELVRLADPIDVPKQIQIGETPEGHPVHANLERPGMGFSGPGVLDVLRYLCVDLLRQSSNYRTQIIICTELAQRLLGMSDVDLSRTSAKLRRLQLVASHEGALRHFEETFFLRRRMVLERDSADVDELREVDPREALPVVLLIAELHEDIYEHVTAPLTPGQNAGAGAMISPTRSRT